MQLLSQAMFPRNPAQARERSSSPVFDKKKSPAVAGDFFLLDSGGYLLSRSVRNSRVASGLKPAPAAPLLTVPSRRLLCHWQRAAPSCRKSSAARKLAQVWENG